MIRPLRTLKAYRRLRRYRQVTVVLFKYGFDDVVDRIGAAPFWGRFRRKTSDHDIPTPRRLRLALTDLGPTFVKFGQLLSTRPDILPDKYIAELEKLQDEVTPFAAPEVRRIFGEELNRNPDQVFGSFEQTPFASGSIAQVHRASLSDGSPVAVKVQRPGIQRLIETDLAILEELTALLERRVRELRWLRPRDLVRQFARSIRRELDFIVEAQAIERFRLNFEGDPNRFVPRVHWDFSTSRILTVDYVQGVKITDLDAIRAQGLDPGVIARNGARTILKEVFEHRLFHADPHPGNFFVLEGNVIAAVDFGIVGSLDDETSEQLAVLLSSVVSRDADGILRVFRALGLLREGIDHTLLKFDIQEFVDRYYGLPLEKMDAEKVIQDMLQVIRRHRILLPVNLALLGRMLAVSAGVGRMLDPHFDIIAEAKPFVKSFLARRMDPKRAARRIAKTWRDYQAAFRTFPTDLEEILAKIKRGQILVSLHHEGLSRLILEMDRSSNRLTFGMIIASLIIGSSVVMQLERGPTILGFPAIGLAGYLIAGLLGLWLVAAILRSGRI